MSDGVGEVTDGSGVAGGVGGGVSVDGALGETGGVGVTVGEPDVDGGSDGAP